MTERTLRKLLEKHGYTYVQETEAATTGTLGVYVGDTNIVIYAVRGKKRIRLGVKDLILRTSNNSFKKNEVYKKL
ncbi:MAG: hypothetical protein LiPW41_627 [Parcubacteria group bacterium LiPW_41]|nr:MAG: hypothetical protein LiPW41_627 [Parcubacteria group bacterium LiPW_41]